MNKEQLKEKMKSYNQYDDFWGDMEKEDQYWEDYSEWFREERAQYRRDSDENI